MLEKVLQVYRQVNLKLNKEDCLFRYTIISIFNKIISQQGVSPDPRKVQTLRDISPPKTKKEVQSFLGILNFLHKFSWITAEVYELQWRLTSVKTNWIWNRMYQDMYDKAKQIVKQAACMKLWHSYTPVPNNQLILYWPWSWLITDQGWHEL